MSDGRNRVAELEALLDVVLRELRVLEDALTNIAEGYGNGAGCNPYTFIKIARDALYGGHHGQSN